MKAEFLNIREDRQDAVDGCRTAVKKPLGRAIMACGYTPQMLWERVKGNGVCHSDFTRRYLRAYNPGTGKVWDMVMRQLDMWGVDW